MLTFMVIGAQRAGSTWLFTCLAGIDLYSRLQKSNCDISQKALKAEYISATKKGEASTGNIQNEINFWSNFDSEKIAWYESLFSHNDIGGDISPHYALLDVSMIKKIHQYFSHLKIIFILRNPIDRAWSQARMHIVHQKLNYEDVSDDWFIREFIQDHSLKMGDYEKTIRAWVSVFPFEQFKLMLYDNLAQDPKAFLEVVCDYVNIPIEHIYRVWPSSFINKKINVNKLSPPIRDTLQPILHGLYASNIRSLSEALQLDLSSWTLPNT